MAVTRRLKKDENFLELIPVRNPDLSYSETKKGLVVITVPNIGFFNYIAQKLFSQPKYSYIHLDAYSSYVWKGINGKRDILDLGRYLKRKFGEDCEPLYERLSKFIQILRDNRYIGLIDKDGIRIK